MKIIIACICALTLTATADASTASRTIQNAAQHGPAAIRAAILHGGPRVATAALKMASSGGSAHNSFGASFRAHSAGCWGDHWSDHWWGFGSWKLGWIRKYQKGWCGNGWRITYDAGWEHGDYAWGPYCITNRNNHNGWDWPFSWKHGGYWASLGVSYPWGCASIRSAHATLRIAANGYWDGRDDFGF